MQSRPAQNPPPSPTASSAQNSSVASGGCAATCVVQALSPVDVAAEGDVVGEGPQELERAADPGQVVQVLVRVGEDRRPALRQPVDHDQRDHPGQGEQPAGQQQVAPAQPRRPALQEEPEQQAEDGQRGADAGVRVPVGEQRRVRQHDRQAARVEVLPDEHRQPDQHQRRDDGDQAGQRQPGAARSGSACVHAGRTCHRPASVAAGGDAPAGRERAQVMSATASRRGPCPYVARVSVTVVLPCLDEAAALPGVLAAVPEGWQALVVDNGSRDGSPELAARLGARVVHEPRRGYGAPVHTGIEAATTEVVAVLDCDGSLDPAELVGPVGLVAPGRGRPGRRAAAGRREPLLAVARAGRERRAGRADPRVDRRRRARHRPRPRGAGGRTCSTSASSTGGSATRWRRCSPRRTPAGAWSRWTSRTGGGRRAVAPR